MATIKLPSSSTPCRDKSSCTKIFPMVQRPSTTKTPPWSNQQPIQTHQPLKPTPPVPHLPRLRPRHPHNRLHFLLPLSILPLIPPRIQPPLPNSTIHPHPRPPPPKLPHRPQQPDTRTPQNPRRRNHKRRATRHRPNSSSSDGRGESAHGGVFGVADQAPEDEDGDVAEAAEEGAGAEVGGLGAGGWVVEVF